MPPPKSPLALAESGAAGENQISTILRLVDGHARTLGQLEADFAAHAARDAEQLGTIGAAVIRIETRLDTIDQRLAVVAIRAEDAHATAEKVDGALGEQGAKSTEALVELGKSVGRDVVDARGDRRRLVRNLAKTFGVFLTGGAALEVLRLIVDRLGG